VKASLRLDFLVNLVQVCVWILFLLTTQRCKVPALLPQPPAASYCLDQVKIFLFTLRRFHTNLLLENFGEVLK
jgi:hypothetical protein